MAMVNDMATRTETIRLFTRALGFAWNQGWEDGLTSANTRGIPYFNAEDNALSLIDELEVAGLRVVPDAVVEAIETTQVVAGTFSDDDSITVRLRLGRVCEIADAAVEDLGRYDEPQNTDEQETQVIQ